jgi:hypothetical protein
MSSRDAGWGHFLSILAWTTACAGKRVAAVPPASTTQEWSGCGQRVQQSLGVRTHSCPSYGLVLDRDAHAARNILWRGQRLRGVPALAGVLKREPVGLSPTRSIRNVPVPWDERTPEWVINAMGQLIGMPLGFFTRSNSHLLVDMRVGRATSIEGVA